MSWFDTELYSFLFRFIFVLTYYLAFRITICLFSIQYFVNLLYYITIRNILYIRMLFYNFCHNFKAITFTVIVCSFRPPMLFCFNFFKNFQYKPRYSRYSRWFLDRHYLYMIRPYTSNLLIRPKFVDDHRFVIRPKMWVQNQNF